MRCYNCKSNLPASFLMNSSGVCPACGSLIRQDVRSAVIFGLVIAAINLFLPIDIIYKVLLILIAGCFYWFLAGTVADEE